MNTNIKLALPKFQSGQVLRHSDLNDLASYLDQQDRLTRMMLVGIGIVEGLALTLDLVANTNDPEKITVGSGIGISSDGYTFFLEQDLVLTKYFPTKLQKYEIECPPATNGNGANGSPSALDVFELLEEDANPDPLANGAAPTQVNPLSLLPDGKYIALIYQKDLADNDSRCFNKTEKGSTVQRFESKVYLIEVAQYAPCNSTPPPPGQSGNPPIPGFVQPYIARFGFTDATKLIDLNQIQSFNNFYQNYKAICTAAIDVISNAYNWAFDTYYRMLGLTPPNPFSNLKAKLELLIAQYDAVPPGNIGRMDIQYLYDYFRDLIAAHNEFITSAYDLRLGGQLLPNTCAHMRHLVLAKIFVERTANNVKAEPGACRSTFRSSAFHEENTGKHRKALFLMERMRALAKIDFPAITLITLRADDPIVFLPVPDPPPTGLSELRITPGQGYSSPLSDRPVPYFYHELLRSKWNFMLHETGRPERILGYRFRGTTPPYDEPLLYELEAYTFFRVEGLLGMPVTLAYQALRQKQQDLDAPFDIQFVKLANLVSGLGSQELAPDDLQMVYETASQEIKCMLQALTPPPPATLLDSISPELMDFNYVDFENQYNAFTSTSTQNFTAINCRIPVLLSVYNEYQNRRQSFHLFHLFADQHPGLEHLAGVPKGGTLVVTYADVPGKSGPVVVGDFALPYTCCADRGGAVFPDTYVAAPPGYFCQNDEKDYELVTYPLGGLLEWSISVPIPAGLPTVQTGGDYIAIDPSGSGKYYFHPELLPATAFVNGKAVVDLVYTKYLKRSTGTITVYQTPAFRIETQGTPVNNHASDGQLVSQTVIFEAVGIEPLNTVPPMQFKWIVDGEPAPDLISPTQARVVFPYSEGQVYNVQLIAKNGICQTLVERTFRLCTEVVSLELRSIPSFEQGTVDPLRVRALPAGGQFQLIDPDLHVIRPVVTPVIGQPDEYDLSTDNMSEIGAYRLIYGLQQCLQEDSVEVTVTARPPDPIALDKLSFCSDDDTNYPILLTPAGGTFSANAPGVLVQNGQFFFNPSLVGLQQYNNQGQGRIRLEYTPQGGTLFTRELSLTQVPEIEIVSRSAIYETGILSNTEQLTCLLKGYTVQFRVRSNIWTTYDWQVLETGAQLMGSANPNATFQFRFLQGNEFHVKVVGTNTALPLSAGCPPENVQIVQILCPDVTVGFDLVRAAQDNILQVLRTGNPNFVENVPAFLFSQQSPGNNIPEFNAWIKVNQPGGQFSIERFNSRTLAFEPAPRGFIVQVAENAGCEEKNISYWLALNFIDLTAGRYRLSYWIEDCTQSIMDTAEFILVEFIPPVVIPAVTPVNVGSAVVQPSVSRSAPAPLPNILDKRLKEHREVIEALGQDNSISRSNAFKFTKTLMDTGKDLPVLNDNFEQALDAAAKKVRDTKDQLKANYELLLDTILRYYLDRLVAHQPTELPASAGEILERQGAEIKDVVDFKQFVKDWQGEQLAENLGAGAVEAIQKVLNKHE